MNKERTAIAKLLQRHFHPESTLDLTVTERTFPLRVRADLQRTVDRFFSEGITVVHFCGMFQRYDHEGLKFCHLIGADEDHFPVSVPPEYEEVDIGEQKSVRCLKNGLWLLTNDEVNFAVLSSPGATYGADGLGLTFQIATAKGEAGSRITHEFFEHLEESVLRAESYREKILSLAEEDSYSGSATGITVHQLRAVARQDVILPTRTLDLLDRNVIDFVRHRPRLAQFGLSTKKGVLFYGPPGTGKTHTIHYLAGALEGHTTFLVAAEQVGRIGEYMTLARLLQPSLVIIEDVDLIARDRDTMSSPCEEALLNKLLNEMDGLRPDADILFVLTTNRPETLESALASRPGRVDQAIEFPLPDDDGRAKLIRLYCHGLSVPEDVVRATVKKTEKVSAAFIKELMRRSAQFHLERQGQSGEVTLEDVENALEELLVTGGSLNRILLGADVDETGE